MIKSIFKYIGVALLLLSSSCSNETDFSSPGVNGEGGLMFRCADMLEVYKGPNNNATRAGGPKTPDEKIIKTIHVFFFGEDGKLLTPKDYTNFSSYQKINLEAASNQAFIPIGTGEGMGQLFEEDYSKVRIVAIANIDATDDANSATDDANTFCTPYSKHGKIRKSSRSADDGENAEPWEIDSYEKLQQWVYYPRIRMSEDGVTGYISQLPEAGMPMIGESDSFVDLTQKPTQAIIVNMRALMAKVNISIELDPDQFSDNYPTLTITEYGVLNMPVAVPFEEPKGGLKNGKSWAKTSSENLSQPGGYFDTYDVTTQPMFHKGEPGDWEHNSCSAESHEFTAKIDPITINKNSAPILFSYYTFENVNMPNYSATRANGEEAFTQAPDGSFVPNYPPGISQTDYQRWKPTLAYEHRASAIILKGRYTNHQGLTYRAQFTIYLGRDTDIDFQVKRNHRYDNNIMIKGLDYVRNSTDDVYTFDGRVNVIYENPLYLAMVGERQIDAHATALPVDVWLMNYEDDTPEPEDYYTEVTFTIPDDNTNPGGNPRNWVQMVMVPREEMESADIIPETGKHRFYAGTGAEKYFYANLLSDIRNNPDRVLKGWTDTGTGARAYEGHRDGAACGSEVTVACSPDKNNSRSRVYFYIDENVGDIGDGEDRSVDVDVTYHAYNLVNGVKSNEVTYNSTITIEQKGLLRVQTSHPGGSGNVSETYIEYYEEYLDHNDPLDEHESGEVYEGLPWGLNNLNIWYRVTTNRDGFQNTEENQTLSHQVFTKSGAFGMMRWVFNKPENQVPKLSTVHLYNEKGSEPASAFHYCSGKNKRNYDGSAAIAASGTKGWYLPGIRELETALVQYYTIFEDFQGKRYWSSACGAPAQEWNITSHDYTHARATRVNITQSGNTTTVNYLPSSYGEEGYVLRTTPLRIRAFYSKN